MKMSVFTVFLFVCCFACTNDRENYTEDMKMKPLSEMAFDKAKWKMKLGKDYPYRDKMLNDIVYNDSVRSLNKDEILKLFGETSYYRTNENYLYYIISQKRLFSWPLHTKAMVIKFVDDNTIDWIKIYE